MSMLAAIEAIGSAANAVVMTKTAQANSLNSGGSMLPQYSNTGMTPPPFVNWGAYGLGVSGIPIAPLPTPCDPFEFACRVAANQPDDPKWRRFQQALFRLDDVICVSSDESWGGSSIVVQLRLENATRSETFMLPFRCSDPVQ